MSRSPIGMDSRAGGCFCKNAGNAKRFATTRGLSCDACYSFEVKWIEASGLGAVHSWTITHHAFNPGFKLELPYILVTIDLEEGVRVQVPLRGAKETDIKLGLPVRIIFEQTKPDLVTPACVTAL